MIKITYKDGKEEEFSNCSGVSEGDTFCSLQDEDENTLFDIANSDIRKIEYEKPSDD
jgi:hypothetical protein